MWASRDSNSQTLKLPADAQPTELSGPPNINMNDNIENSNLFSSYNILIFLIQYFYLPRAKVVIMYDFSQAKEARAKVCYVVYGDYLQPW